MIGSETGDNRSFITVSSFGKSLLKQDELFEEAFFIMTERGSSFIIDNIYYKLPSDNSHLIYNIFIKSTRWITSKSYNLSKVFPKFVSYSHEFKTSLTLGPLQEL